MRVANSSFTKSQNGPWMEPELDQLLRWLRCVHVWHVLWTLSCIPECGRIKQIRASLLPPWVSPPLRARPLAARRGERQVQHRGKHLRRRVRLLLLPLLCSMSGRGGNKGALTRNWRKRKAILKGPFYQSSPHTHEKGSWMEIKNCTICNKSPTLFLPRSSRTSACNDSMHSGSVK